MLQKINKIHKNVLKRLNYISIAVTMVTTRDMVQEPSSSVGDN